ncbi:MAG: ABC transporter, ATP-binding protein [uncultured Campylobacterales bacterium]|uniref:ABC transporter, ATP-binding protein n=1 Tax=uncultured Campylobacterales bacterium TaxID=352960 RepID=A0A6S6T4M3_9BACT|nr:MAG: ABC transporter, ATP-binding protein [uncultured Campylobacterales bacterium]
MNIKLENIGILKNADVTIDGLTVIAGENDTGKSTVGKSLYFALKSLFDLKNLLGFINKDEKLNTESDKRFGLIEKLIFDNQISEINNDGYISLAIKEDRYKFNIINQQAHIPENFEGTNRQIKNIKLPIMIETPLVWNFNKFFNQMSILESRSGMIGEEISIDYPYFLKELHYRLNIPSKKQGLNIVDNISLLINGDFRQDGIGNFFFYKDGKKIELLNTATGIKYFGILQILSKNNYLNENTLLILDEPEVHLHPKWQLEMAKVIVNLVKNGVKILVNSHSPYMIEALKRYSDIEGIKDKTNFYLAEDGYIKKENDSNTDTLAKIFEKLSEPFDLFEEMENERFKNG